MSYKISLLAFLLFSKKDTVVEIVAEIRTVMQTILEVGSVL
jgi:hypothetical protein